MEISKTTKIREIDDISCYDGYHETMQNWLQCPTILKNCAISDVASHYDDPGFFGKEPGTIERTLDGRLVGGGGNWVPEGIGRLMFCGKRSRFFLMVADFFVVLSINWS